MAEAGDRGLSDAHVHVSTTGATWWDLASRCGVNAPLAVTASAVAKTVCSPLDRVRLVPPLHDVAQNSALYSYRSAAWAYVHQFLRIYRGEDTRGGIRAFWRGNVRNVLLFAPQFGTSLALFDVLLRADERWCGQPLSGSCAVDAGACAAFPRFVRVYGYGAVAGAAVRVLAHPFLMADAVVRVDRAASADAGGASYLDTLRGPSDTQPRTPPMHRRAEAVARLWRYGDTRLLHGVVREAGRGALLYGVGLGTSQLLHEYAPARVRAQPVAQLAVYWAACKLALGLELVWRQGHVRGAASVRAVSPAVALLLYTRAREWYWGGGTGDV